MNMTGFTYGGRIRFSMPDSCRDIVKLRLRQYRLDQYIQMEGNLVIFEEKGPLENGDFDLFLDLLCFIEDNGIVSLRSYANISREPSFEKDKTKYLRKIFVHEGKLFLYEYNCSTHAEFCSSVQQYFSKIKRRNMWDLKTNASRIFALNDGIIIYSTYISPWKVDPKETRRLLIDGALIPLFEPFMRAPFHIGKGKHIQPSKNMLLPNGEWHDACKACVNILKKISANGCRACRPAKLKSIR